MREELVCRVARLEARLDDLVMPEVARKGGVAVFNSAPIAIPTAVWTALTFDSERWDDAGFHSLVVNTSRLTVPTGYEGWYAITGHATLDASVAGTHRGLAIYLNGTTFIDVATVPWAGDNIGCHLSIPRVYYLSATDFIELYATQDTGGNLNVLSAGNYTPEFAMVQVI